MAFEHLSGQVALLPGGVVDGRYRQLRQFGGLVGPRQPVKFGQVAHDDAGRPAVRDDVMVHDDEQVVVIANPGQPEAQQRASVQVEWPADLLGDQVKRLVQARRVRPERQVHNFKWCVARFVDDLERDAAFRAEPGAQALVPREQATQRRAERGHVKRPAQPQRELNVVDRHRRLKLMQEPQVALLQRDRQYACARNWHNPVPLRLLRTPLA